MLKFVVKSKKPPDGTKVKDTDPDAISTSSTTSSTASTTSSKNDNDVTGDVTHSNKQKGIRSGPGSTSSVTSGDSDLGSMSTDTVSPDSPSKLSESQGYPSQEENSMEITMATKNNKNSSVSSESILRNNTASRCRKNVSFQDTVYMIESAHDSSSGIASDDQAGPNSSSSYLEGAPSSKASSGYAETTTGFRYYDIDDDDEIDADDDDDDFGFPSRKSQMQTFHTQAQVHGQWSRAMTSPNLQKQMGYHNYSQADVAYNQKNLTAQAAVRYSNSNGNSADIYRDYHSKKGHSYFDILPDNVITKIFSCLTSDQLCRNALVCRRFYDTVWQPSLWTRIRITDPKIDVDTALRVLSKRLSFETPHVCIMVESISLSGCLKLTDRGLYAIAKRCLELRHLEISNCPEVTNIALFELVSRCVNLELLNVSGCPSVTCVCLTPEATVQAAAYGKQLLSLRHLDMTDCVYLDDSSLQILASYCSQLVYLYLRRCYKVSDIGVQYVANYCTSLKEFSLCDCRNVTDFGMREIAKLGKQLRYLSVAKCDKISDVGVKYVAQYCRRMRYLNVRGCPAVSDDSLDVLAQCCTRLKSLDIGKCDITDEGIQSIAENSPQLRRLSLKSCDAITDQGILSLAYNCPNLQQLNIQDCHLSVEAYRAVKRNCKRCIIEHTNPGFY